MSAAFMIEEVRRLGEDLPELVASAGRQLATHDVTRRLGGIRRIILTGCGDSLHAAVAASLAFAEIAECPTEILGPRTSIAALRRHGSGIANEATLLVGISASGGTPSVVEALRGAREAGVQTMALTGRPGSASTEVAEDAVVLDLASPSPPPSPGIRTFQASLVSLFVLAGRLAVARGAADTKQSAEWCEEILAAGASLSATVEFALPMARVIAENTVHAPISLMVAAGPHLGIARYAAAKRIEASGLFAAAQDLEEWWHVERFAYPVDMPVIIIAPPGATGADAARSALNARGLGRRVIAVCAREATDIGVHAHAVLPVMGFLREALAPIASHPALTLVAAQEALILGRRPFQQDDPEIRKRLEVYRAGLSGLLASGGH
jgi:glucosamine--fructose-6-phosphate aminotransferase (isomerizing)